MRVLLLTRWLLTDREPHSLKTHVPEQVRKTAEAALEAIEGGMCVVIGLQSTGEANTSATREELGDVLDDFVSGERLTAPAAR